MNRHRKARCFGLPARLYVWGFAGPREGLAARCFLADVLSRALSSQRTAPAACEACGLFGQ